MASQQQGGIQIDEDLAHQRLEWRLERIGWAAMARLLGAAGGGVVGYVPMGRARAGEARRPALPPARPHDSYRCRAARAG